MDAIVGYTGFVGSNICRSHHFDMCFNSQNITLAFDTTPDVLVYCGVRAEKFIANKNPDGDYEHIQDAIENIKKIRPKKIILISTVDVLSCLDNSNEDVCIEVEKLDAYGRNRYILESWVMENCRNATIIRLPALFGEGIKKNFIYDIIHPIPKLINKNLYSDFSEKSGCIKMSYYKNQQGFYQKKNDVNEIELNKAFELLDFSSLKFTDSRSEFQFYPLHRLWNDISIAQRNKIGLVHLATEPIQAGILYSRIIGKDFVNEINTVSTIRKYNFVTKYDSLFGGNNGYLLNAEEVICEIQGFVGGSLR